MKKGVFCIVDNERQVQQIIDRLMSSRFSNEDISILVADTQGRFTKTSPEYRDTAMGADREAHVRGKRSSIGCERHTKAPEGATAGAVTGGLIGGTIGLLAGIGSLAIPGLGPFIAAGPIMAALSGSAIGGSIGLLTGALIGAGIPEVEAKLYEGKLRQGNFLLAVHADSQEEIDEAKQIIEAEGGQDVCTCAEKVARR